MKIRVQGVFPPEGAGGEFAGHVYDTAPLLIPATPFPTCSGGPGVLAWHRAQRAEGMSSKRVRRRGSTSPALERTLTPTPVPTTMATPMPSPTPTATPTAAASPGVTERGVHYRNLTINTQQLDTSIPNSANGDYIFEPAIEVWIAC